MELVVILSLKWIIIRWLFVAIVCAGVTCGFYAFVSIFVREKAIRVLMTALMIALSVLVYIAMHQRPTIVRMQEDVLYIKPN